MLIFNANNISIKRPTTSSCRTLSAFRPTNKSLQKGFTLDIRPHSLQDSWVNHSFRLRIGHQSKRAKQPCQRYHIRLDTLPKTFKTTRNPHQKHMIRRPSNIYARCVSPEPNLSWPERVSNGQIYLIEPDRAACLFAARNWTRSLVLWAWPVDSWWARRDSEPEF